MSGEDSVYRYDHLERPAVTAGSLAIIIGAQNGLFPQTHANASDDETGGLWTGEMKLCQGFYLAVDDVPLLCADAYEASPDACAFHYRMQAQGLHVMRRQFVPDGVRGMEIDLTLENLRDTPRMAEISFTVRTDIRTLAAVRGEDNTLLGRDVGEYDARTQAFYARESRNPWHVVWGADEKNRVLSADLPSTVYGFEPMQGKGINGRLFYRLRLAAKGEACMRLFIAGGYASRSKAEEALGAWRENADSLYEQKHARVERMMACAHAELADVRLARCFNWSKVYFEWMTCAVGRDGVALCEDLTENPVLYAEGWASAMRGLLAVGRADLVGRMLVTIAWLCSRENLAPGRMPQRVSLGGHVLHTGGPLQSAQYVSLVRQTLLYGGDRTLAKQLLPQVGLCMSYLRRATHGFSQIPAEWLEGVHEAVCSNAYILGVVGEDASEWTALALSLPAPAEPGEPGEDATLGEAAIWHGERGHVEQMVGCLTAMARTSASGLPGALHGERDRPDVLVTAAATADFVWPMARCLFGILPDAPQRMIDFMPHTPIGWSGWRVTALTLGDTRFDIASERVSPSQARYTLRADKPGWRVRYARDGERFEEEIGGELTLLLGD